MIFITAGTQESFDRLIKVADELADLLPDVPIVAQALASTYRPNNVRVINFVTPVEFENYIKNASLVISHAGMGTIISALVHQKPIIVMPRLLKFKEHRNEHQLATALKLDQLQYINVAYNEKELLEKVLAMWPDKLKCLHRLEKFASARLINSLMGFIND